MNRQEWDECTEIGPMIDFLIEHAKVDDRTLRLFAVSCWDWLEGGHTWNPSGSKMLVAKIQEFTNREVPYSEVQRLLNELIASPCPDEWEHKSGELDMAIAVSKPEAIEAAKVAASTAARISGKDAAESERLRMTATEGQVERASDESYEKVAKRQAERLRSMVGDPFA